MLNSLLCKILIRTTANIRQSVVPTFDQTAGLVQLEFTLFTFATSCVNLLQQLLHTITKFLHESTVLF